MAIPVQEQVLITTRSEEVSADRTVAVFGSGIGGLTAAHELAERGYNVTVYERASYFGGKARSIPVPGSAPEGRENLPGEHGFRFFPGFYKHLPDTMKRIPFGGIGSKDGTVHGNLVLGDYLGMYTADSELLVPSHPPKKFSDFVSWMKAVLGDLAESAKIPKKDVLYFLQRVILMASTCKERWENEYEKMNYWDFMHASELSPEAVKVLILSETRSLVACQADKASLRTVGQIFIRLIYTMFKPGEYMDSMLNGPTNEQFLGPWMDMLKSKYKVKFVDNAELKRFVLENDKKSVKEAHIYDRINKKTVAIKAANYFSAIPAEKFALVIDEGLAAAAPSIANVDKLQVEWMNGIQYYLKEDYELVKGHAGFMDSPWALTAISQPQFWARKVTEYGKGDVKGIISVDISDWNTPGLKDGPSRGRTAKECTKDEVVQEVWYQLGQHNRLNETVFPPNQENLLYWFMDNDLQWNPKTGVSNMEPLLINTADSLRYRPEAHTELENLYLASDYVRTTADLACMEAANEAARRAVTKMMERQGSSSPPPAIYDYAWPTELKFLQNIDCSRYKAGKEPLGWNFPVPKH